MVEAVTPAEERVAVRRALMRHVRAIRELLRLLEDQLDQLELDKVTK